MSHVFALILTLIVSAAGHAAEIGPLDPALRRQMIQELTVNLNQPGNPIREQLLDYYESCDDQWMGCRGEGRRLAESGRAGFGFTQESVERKAQQILRMDISGEDACPKGDCNPFYRGIESYLVIWHEDSSSKWEDAEDDLFLINASIAYDTITDANDRAINVRRGPFRFKAQTNSLKIAKP